MPEPCWRGALAGLLLAAAAAASAAPPAEAEQAALLLVGDSTLAPRSGYGDALCERLAPGWACLNLARGGRSTKSYREEGLWDRVLVRLRTRQGDAPHVVLIQFGHNDQPGKPGRSTDLATEFPANLRRYVEEVRAAGGLPVLGTPLTRRSFKDGRLQGDLEPWADTTRRVARELGVPLVDTLGSSAARVQALGEAVADTLAVAAKPAPGEAPGRGSNSFDRTHVGPRGACLFAALSAPLLAQAVPALRDAFVSAGQPDEAACLALPPPPPAATLGRASELHRGTYTMPGWAVGTQGGRGGRVLRVTNLQASGPGSLRAALEARGPRNIVFEVGGVIDLQGGKLDIREPFVTIAGQTAPAPGITLIKGEVRVGTHDVIVQHLRFRPGAWGRPARSGGDQDGLSTGAGAHQVIVDHCSFSWATDENLSVGGPRFPGSTPDEWRRHTGRAITFSHNLIYEGLGHSVHAKSEHSKGTLIHDNATGILLHANLYASNRERNALFKGGVQAAMVNNLVFNPGTRAVHYNLPAGEWEGQPIQTGRIALLGNLLRHGPDTRAGLPLFVLGGHGDVELHLDGNAAVDFLGRPLPMTAVDNAGRARIVEVPAAQATLPPDLRLLPVAELELQLTRAAGARPWDRDEADQKLLADVAEGRGRLIDDETQGLGYPRHAATRRPFDAAAWQLHDMSPRAGWASLFPAEAPPAVRAATAAPKPALPAAEPRRWAAGLEGQRRADLGNGQFRNPVLAGDFPDPTVLKDGPDYYLTHSSFEAVPGLLIWHSRDLVNWQPLAPALTRYIGSVWAPELVKHGGRYYLYVPAKLPAPQRGAGGGGARGDIFVMHAPHPRGPWSAPVALGIDRIDPGHAVDEQGRRWLFLNGGARVPLSADGLRTTGPLETVYEGWRYPEDWVVESYSQEGPKMLRKDGWWHMTLAVGGTAGPPTGHMVISARARTLAGPWEHSPHNPLVRTRSRSEAWWSRGHATLVEGPTPGDWYMLYHGYEAGYHTLGRQMLLEPIEWTPEGWFRSRLAAGADVGEPLPLPRGGSAVPHGRALSDDFQAPQLATPWSFFRGDESDAARVRVGGGTLALAARGSGPADSRPLSFVAGDRAYEVEVDIDPDAGASAGLLLFYSERLYAGLGLQPLPDGGAALLLHRYGTDQRRGSLPLRADGQPWRPGQPLRLRLRLEDHVLTLHTSTDGGVQWQKFGTQMEVSGYHHNVAGGFMSLRPALYAAGQGQVRFRRLVYRALP